MESGVTEYLQYVKEFHVTTNLIEPAPTEITVLRCNIGKQTLCLLTEKI